VQKVFDALNLQYPRATCSAKGRTVVYQAVAVAHPHHPVARRSCLRETDKADSTFIDTILRHEHNGRIHTEFHQLRSDDGGTVTGRFSSSNPNLQQIPARDPEIKKLIRGLFIPEEGTSGDRLTTLRKSRACWSTSPPASKARTATT
jgi:DNA polymerase I-like protein with 3'-5' exonuclease and polymerase domains